MESRGMNKDKFIHIPNGFNMEEMKKSMLEKTEALRQRNMSQKEFRERNVLRGLRPDGGRFY